MEHDDSIDAARNQFNTARCRAWRLEDGTIIAAGSIVKLKTGTSPIRVTAIYDCPDRHKPVLDGVYTKSNIDVWGRPLAHFNPIETVGHEFDEIDENEMTTEGADTLALYQTLEEKPRFGIYLTKDSAGRTVLEMKGTGDVEAFDPKAVEEVMPYTVAVQQVTDTHGSKVHIEMTKGDVTKDDLLFSGQDGNIYRVAQLDTKSKRATEVAKYKFRKLATTALGAEDDGADLIE